MLLSLLGKLVYIVVEIFNYYMEFEDRQISDEAYDELMLSLDQSIPPKFH